MADVLLVPCERRFVSDGKLSASALRRLDVERRAVCRGTETLLQGIGRDVATAWNQRNECCECTGESDPTEARSVETRGKCHDSRRWEGRRRIALVASPSPISFGGHHILVACENSPEPRRPVTRAL